VYTLGPVVRAPHERRLEEEVAGLPWYHTLELAPGVVTPGWLDTRRVADEVPFPASLAGKRCLDVGTADGFWAFEMERRGAAEVVAIDVLDPGGWDWPVRSDPAVVADIGASHARGRGFELARRELGSSVERLGRSVYDLDPEELGRFDVVYVGSLLVHLRDPVLALERVRAVCAGTLIVVDGIDLPLSIMFRRMPVARIEGRGRPWWWYLNAAGLARVVEAAGFDVVDGPRRLFVPQGAGQALSRRRPWWILRRKGREFLVIAWRGEPHALVVARPV
jgi:tRNA (mo5U34)-methyltransferase